MPPDLLPLADDFAAATRPQWLALVEKTLKGAGIESLESRSPDGLTLQALYTAENGEAPARFAPPISRTGEAGWDIRSPIAAADPAVANAQALEELAGGATSLLVSIDAWGREGVAAGSAEDLARVLDGVSLEIAPVALEAGFVGRTAAEWLASAAKASPRAALALHLDPLSAFAAAGSSPGPIEAHLRAAADLAARQAAIYPKASLFRASGRLVHEAGGAPALELAFAAAAALAYAKALDGAGVPPPQAFGRIVLGLAVDADILASTAKLRAARLVLGRIAEACGAPPPSVVEARSSRRMLTRADAWNNLIRLTVAGFAAVVGGADAVALDPFTQPLGPATGQGRRLARNTQLILMDEAHVGAPADPLGGAWAVEALTSHLAAEAWAAFQAIEAAGGAVEALRSGLVADAVAVDRAALEAAITDKKLRIVGVTDFVAKTDRPIETDRPRPSAADAVDAALPGPDSRCPALIPVRLEDLVR